MSLFLGPRMPYQEPASQGIGMESSQQAKEGMRWDPCIRCSCVFQRGWRSSQRCVAWRSCGSRQREPRRAPPASGRIDGAGERSGHLLDSHDGLLSEIPMHAGFAYSVVVHQRRDADPWRVAVEPRGGDGVRVLRAYEPGYKVLLAARLRPLYERH